MLFDDRPIIDALSLAPNGPPSNRLPIASNIDDLRPKEANRNLKPAATEPIRRNDQREVGLGSPSVIASKSY
jgi:hypothetical protein